MSKVLVAYATGSGCTAGVAEKIGATLASKGIEVDVVPVDSKSEPAGYDAVVAGSGVRAGSWHPRAKKWVARNASALKGKPLAFFTVGTAPTHSAGGFDEMRGYTDKLLADTGVEPVDIGLFAGWFVTSKFNFIERWIMRIAKTPEGDHRDWEAIEAWAARVSAKLQPAVR
ncbi:MAG TPA: flavodoxin domain-containing protein [Coriobacteriia bacterium]|jgi:menaquinone-dependent protoporphyrinogen oxidase